MHKNSRCERFLWDFGGGWGRVRPLWGRRLKRRVLRGALRMCKLAALHMHLLWMRRSKRRLNKRCKARRKNSKARRAKYPPPQRVGVAESSLQTFKNGEAKDFGTNSRVRADAYARIHRSLCKLLSAVIRGLERMCQFVDIQAISASARGDSRFWRGGKNSSRHENFGIRVRLTVKV